MWLIAYLMRCQLPLKQFTICKAAYQQLTAAAVKALAQQGGPPQQGRPRPLLTFSLLLAESSLSEIQSLKICPTGPRQTTDTSYIVLTVISELNMYMTRSAL